MMKRICEVEPGIGIRERLFDHFPILDGDVAQPEQVSKHGRQVRALAPLLILPAADH